MLCAVFCACHPPRFTLLTHPPQVVFPRRAGKPKAGDAAAEELATAAQLKGKLMPVSTPAPALEKVAITADMKVRPLGQAAAACGCSEEGAAGERVSSRGTCCYPGEASEAWNRISEGPLLSVLCWPAAVFLNPRLRRACSLSAP